MCIGDTCACYCNGSSGPGWTDVEDGDVDHWKRHAEEPRVESCKIRHNLSRPIMRATYTLLARGRKCRRMFNLCGLR